MQAYYRTGQSMTAPFAFPGADEPARPSENKAASESVSRVAHMGHAKWISTHVKAPSPNGPARWYARSVAIYHRSQCLLVRQSHPWHGHDTP